MKSEWKQVTLSDVVDILGDGIHGTPTYSVDGEYAFINGNNLVDGQIQIKDSTKRVDSAEYSKHKKPLSDRTIFVSINGTLGNIAVYRGEKVILGKSACYFNVSKNVCKDYIRFVVMSPDFQSYLHNQATGTTIKNVSLKQMREYPFLLPSLEIQKAISAILLALNDKIELNQKINENLERQAQTIYESRFTDTNGCLADICDYSKEKTLVSQLTLDNYYSTENMLAEKGGFVQSSNLPTTVQTTRCNPGDILVSNIRPYFKKIVYCLSDGGCSTDVLCLTPKERNLSAYLFYTLYADKFFDYMVAGSKGTKMPRGDKQQIMTYPIHVPSDVELSGYNSIAQPILAKIEGNRKENLRLAASRDTLLPKLMAGEIDLQEV